MGKQKFNEFTWAVNPKKDLQITNNLKVSQANLMLHNPEAVFSIIEDVSPGLVKIDLDGGQYLWPIEKLKSLNDG